MNTENILKAISESTAALFTESAFGGAVSHLLRTLGGAVGASRVYFFENHRGRRGEILASQRYEWVAKGFPPQIDNAAMQNLSLKRFKGLGKHIRGKPLAAAVRTLAEPLRSFLSAQDILSIALVPVYVRGAWHGFIGFDDCAVERRWSGAEIDALRTAATLLGGAIERRRSEDQLRSILEDGIDSLGTGLFIIEPGFRVLWMNRAMGEFFGARRGDVIGTDMRTFVREKLRGIVANHAEFAKRMLGAFRNDEEVERLRCEVVRGPRRRRRILYYSCTLITRGPLAGGRIAHCIDMTPLEESAAALRVSEKKYRDLVEKMNEGLAHIDEQMRFRYVNSSFCNMLGYTKEEMAVRPVEFFLDNEERANLRAEWQQRKRGAHSHYDVVMRAKSGEMVPFRVSATPVFDEAGKFRGSYAVLLDIRERRSLERLKEDILRDASHELKAPTAKIMMGLDLVKKHLAEPMGEEERLGIAMIETEVRRMRKDVDSLIDLSILESRTMRLALKRCDLVRLLRGAIAEFSGAAGEKRVSFSLNIQKRKLAVRGDAGRLALLFRHLLDNAVKFSPPGVIAIAARHGAGGVIVSISGRGRGIEPRYLEQIFDKYYQRYPSEPGLGLGLAICRRIVELHQGRIWAESGGSGRGMTILMALPL